MNALDLVKEVAVKYDFGTHECLDRTYLVMELLSYVSEHPQVKANEEWRELADTAHGALWKLYQSIGAVDDPQPDDTQSTYSRLCKAENHHA